MDRGSFHDLAHKIKDLPIAITIEMVDGRNVGITHAEPSVKVWSQEDDVWGLPTVRQVALWGRSLIKAGKPVKTKGIDLTIHGHTPLKKPLRIGNAVFIDTGCVYGDHLTLINLDEAFELPCSGK
jgi:serine/threonine protein phosphatase 1